MNSNMIIIGIIAVLLLSLQSGFTRAASQVLRPVVKMALRFCMPPFLYRFMMQ